MATALSQCMDFQDFTITHWSLPNGGGNTPAKIVLPPKMRPITFTLFQANCFWFPPSSDSGLGRSLPLANTFPHSLFIQVSGQKSTVAGNSKSDPEWVLACNPSINQPVHPVWCFVLVGKPYKAVSLISGSLHLLFAPVPQSDSMSQPRFKHHLFILILWFLQARLDTYNPSSKQELH